MNQADEIKARIRETFRKIHIWYNRFAFVAALWIFGYFLKENPIQTWTWYTVPVLFTFGTFLYYGALCISLMIGALVINRREIERYIALKKEE